MFRTVMKILKREITNFYNVNIDKDLKKFISTTYHVCVTSYR